MSARRTFLARVGGLLLLCGSALLTGCATRTVQDDGRAPIVFVHGNGDAGRSGRRRCGASSPTAGRPGGSMRSTCRIPLARDEDPREQPGRTSTAEHMAYLKAEVDAVISSAPAPSKVVLVGNSRGGNAIRNYIQNGGGETKVSHAILGGTPNHGVWAVKGLRESSEFSGTGPFLTSLNAPKNASGDEVTPGGQMADDPLRQQRQVRAARWPVDRLAWHAHQRHLRRPGTARRDQRRPPTASTTGRRPTRLPRSTRCIASSPAKRRRPWRSCRTSSSS